jgi:hypothetical protein
MDHKLRFSITQRLDYSPGDSASIINLLALQDGFKIICTKEAVSYTELQGYLSSHSTAFLGM